MIAGVIFLRSSGLPFLQVAMTMSPTQADGRRFGRPPIPTTETTNKFLAPELSAQFITQPTGRPRVVRNLLPDTPPRPARWEEQRRSRIPSARQSRVVAANQTATTTRNSERQRREGA